LTFRFLALPMYLRMRAWSDNQRHPVFSRLTRDIIAGMTWGEVELEPYTRQLSGKLRELRFYCGGERIRISYWIASGRRIITLTVFAKTRMRETAEIARATAAMARCQAEVHTADDEDR
jgi:Phage derived protein Gp49-like (DUF891)